MKRKTAEIGGRADIIGIATRSQDRPNKAPQPTKRECGGTRKSKRDAGATRG